MLSIRCWASASTSFIILHFECAQQKTNERNSRLTLIRADSANRERCKWPQMEMDVYVIVSQQLERQRWPSSAAKESQEQLHNRIQTINFNDGVRNILINRCCTRRRIQSHRNAGLTQNAMSNESKVRRKTPRDVC